MAVFRNTTIQASPTALPAIQPVLLVMALANIIALVAMLQIEKCFLVVHVCQLVRFLAWLVWRTSQNAVLHVIPRPRDPSMLLISSASAQLVILTIE